MDVKGEIRKFRADLMTQVEIHVGSSSVDEMMSEHIAFTGPSLAKLHILAKAWFDDSKAHLSLSAYNGTKQGAASVAWGEQADLARQSQGGLEDQGERRGESERAMDAISEAFDKFGPEFLRGL